MAGYFLSLERLGIFLMLNRLLIKNYVLIDQLDITFSDRLNIITGETGAGKSIILGALGLILGERAESKYFYNQDEKCIIEGYFHIEGYNLEGLFKKYDLDYEKETIIRREITPAGKSRAFINDSPVQLATVKIFGEKLIDIHAQHATLQIGQSSFQCLVLDAFAGSQKLYNQYKESYSTLQDLNKKLGTLQEELSAAQSEADYHQFLFDELQKVSPKPGEIGELDDELSKLLNAEDILQNLYTAEQTLGEVDGNILSSLKTITGGLRHVEQYSEEIAEVVSRLESTIIELEDIGQEVSSIQQGIVFDEQRQQQIQERLDELHTLLNKHRVSSTEELQEILLDIEGKLEHGAGLEDELIACQKLHQEQYEQSLKLAEELSKKRVQVKPKFEKQVKNLLGQMGMPHAELIVEIQPLEEGKLSERGLDEIRFTFSANKGINPGPVQRTASGGELSRIMLAIKSILAQSTKLPTLIFDEIDTGISGQVALSVGQLIESLGEHMQVMAISHLPQISSKGQAHFKVFKDSQESTSKTRIKQLSLPERITEIAVMIDGENPGDAALKHAKELLSK